MLAALYKTKKDLKAAVGQPFRYEETSLFGNECSSGKMLTVVGPSPYVRKWYANVWVDDRRIIIKVK